MNTLESIVSCWRQAKRVVVFTGAGMSTESGLADFRSARGLWKQRPESLATLTALYEQPDEFYFFYQWRISKLWTAQPNSGHLALAALARAGHIQQVITQNVDGLHQRAGSEAVIELHGTLRTVSCLNCQAHYDSRQLLPVQPTWEADYRAGRYLHGTECFCRECNENLRPDVVLFGEPLPDRAWRAAIASSRSADLFVVIGSSLAVSPANYCPQAAQECGAKLFILNADQTPFDDVADWVVREQAGPFLTRLAEQIIG